MEKIDNSLKLLENGQLKNVNDLALEEKKRWIYAYAEECKKYCKSFMDQEWVKVDLEKLSVDERQKLCDYAYQANKYYKSFLKQIEEAKCQNSNE